VAADGLFDLKPRPRVPPTFALVLWGGRPEETTSARAQFRHQYPILTAEQEAIVREHLGRVLVEENGGWPSQRPRSGWRYGGRRGRKRMAWPKA